MTRQARHNAKERARRGALGLCREVACPNKATHGTRCERHANRHAGYDGDSEGRKP